MYNRNWSPQQMFSQMAREHRPLCSFPGEHGWGGNKSVDFFRSTGPA